MLVWLHGKGTAGDDNASHLRHLGTLVLKKPWQRQRYAFFVLAVQCPRENPVWTTSAQEADDMLNVVLAALAETTRAFPVDADRIYLAGASSGGGGCWELAMRRPNVFAAVAPMAAGAADASRVNCLLDVPVWAFHSRSDSGTPIDGARRMVGALHAAGGRAHLTEVDSFLHDCWTAAFNEHDLLDWLLAQKRGDASSPAPGAMSISRRVRGALAGWTTVELAGQIGIPLVVLLAIWNARRQRRKRWMKAEG